MIKKDNVFGYIIDPAIINNYYYPYYKIMSLTHDNTKIIKNKTLHNIRRNSLIMRLYNFRNEFLIF
mgnify:FL=1